MGDTIAAFSVEQVASLTKLSVHQLREWDDDGFFEPTLAYSNRRSPYSRIYSFNDVVGLRTLALLRKDHKVSRQHLRKAAVKLKEHSGSPWSELTIYVVKGEVHFKNPRTGLVEGAVSGQYAAAIVISSVADDMRAKAEALKNRKNDARGRIESHRHVMGGEPVFAGTRILVASVKSLAAAGYSPQRIIREYPDLAPEDVQAALDFNGKLTRAA